MDWVEANLSLQIAAEERIGALMRVLTELRRSREDAAFAEMTRQLDGAR